MLIIAGEQAKLTEAIRAIVGEFGEQVVKDLQGIRSVADLSAKVKSLRESVETLEIEKARKQEEFERQKREVEHKVGLERKRQEFELESAKRDAKLTVREENLAADRERFNEQMQFHDKRFTEEVGYLKGLMEQLMQRLPDITVNGELNGRRARAAVR